MGRGKRRTFSLLVAGAMTVVGARAGAQVRVLKGPYLMDVRPDSVAVLAELSSVASLEVTAETESGERASVSSPPMDFHEVVLSSLAPDTRYEYVVRTSDTELGRGTFVTAPLPGEGPVRFLVFGDNRSNSVAHQAVIRTMLGQSGEFVLNTGDMVAKGSDPADWQELFDIERPLLRDTPLYTVLGNHEIYSDGSGLARYQRYLRAPDDSHGELFYAFTYGLLRVVVLDSNDDVGRGSPQGRWLEAELTSAEGDPRVAHIVALMHHGPYSSGYHGGNAALFDGGVVESFERHGVALVFSGHDHHYERGEAEGLRYIVTGGGGAPLYTVNHRLPHELSFVPRHHFVVVDADQDGMRITTIGSDGTRIERCGFRGEGPWICDGAPADDPSRGPILGTGTLGMWVEWPLFWWIVGASVGVVLMLAFAIRRRRGRGRSAQGP